MRRLRFNLSGHCMALCLRIMPRSRQKEMLIDALDQWVEDAAREIGGFRVNVSLHQRFK